MKYFTAIAALVSVVPHIAAVTINTPFNVVQCQPQMLSWDGTPTFYLTIIPGGQPNAAPLKSFAAQTANSLTWTVDIPAGTSVTFALKDSTGATGFTDVVTIQPSNDRSCLTGDGPLSKPADNSGSVGTADNTNPPPQVPASTSTPGGSHLGPNSAAGAGAPLASQPTTTTRVVGGIQAVSSTTSSPLTSATRAESSAESRFTVGGFAMVAAIAVFGTFFL